jgi:wyosine [tRNA(Phe)-imidazoG37] synthetase (radical SAM superfamily)
LRPLEAEPDVTIFGPVPSRRLGRSLGVNNIPPKICSYSCAYCQVGRTRTLETQRRAFYDPQNILLGVHRRLGKLRRNGERVDFISFVPDGEPTLDHHLGRAVELLKPLGVPVAVISNASLIDREEVRRDLGRADWVSLKIDAASERSWRRLNRPHRSLKLASILEGMLRFRDSFPGRLVTETMLVAGCNDGQEDLDEAARFLERLKPAVAYLSIPTRPPAEMWARAPKESAVITAYQLFASRGLSVELLNSSEGDAFSGGGNAAEDLLAITAVHPMRRQAVQGLLERSGSGWSLMLELLKEGRLVEVEYGGQTYYVRRFPRGKVKAEA